MPDFFLDLVRDLLKEFPAVHFDEFEARVTGRLHRVHLASNALLTLIERHERRGALAMEGRGVIANMAGVAVHDGWANEMAALLIEARHAVE